MKKIIITLSFIISVTFVFAQSNKVTIKSDNSGFKIIANGKEFMINGINWDYVPIGNGILDKGIWDKSDDLIKTALDREMSLFKNMGVNAIRTYGLEPKWITYIYENYGIYTMLNTQFGAYGLTINGAWTPQTDYTDAATLEVLMKEVTDMAKKYKNTPGLLLYMVGNENNYHLSWTGAETGELPVDGVDPGIRKAAEGLYKAFNAAALEIKKIDTSVPVAICNGDLLYLDIVKKYCKDIDIYGTNMYRGISFGDAFQRVKNELNKPMLFAEFGSDAFNAKENKEDQHMQAYYNLGNWKDIYKNAAGLGLAGNSLGGFTFQSSDGWWKWNQSRDLDIHNTIATWANGGYAIDLALGGKNMNEEWFGICAKGPTSADGLYDLYPRAAYYALKEAHRLNPYEKGVDLAFIDNYFDGINIMDAVLKARGDKAALEAKDKSKIKLSTLRAEFTTFNTGGSNITTPDQPDPDDPNTFPNQLGFDHMESYFVGIEAKPANNMRAEVTMNILGNVAENPIDEIFYENRGRPVRTVNQDGEEVILNDNERLRVYQAEFEWNAKDFDVRGFYRTGHYHWQYEGDFFGLYPEANYGPNLDIYGGEILGFEVDGKNDFDGFKAAFGPQLWWGANPTMLFKYHKEFKGWGITGVYNRDFDTDIPLDQFGNRALNADQVRSGVIPPWPTERAALAIEKDFGKFGLTLGGIWGGNPLNGTPFQDVTGSEGNYVVYEDQINANDNWGGKAKITYQGGRFNWYAQGAVMGLVANGGADATLTFTGWQLKDSGSGNQSNFLSGFTYQLGDFQIAPNFMWRKPLVDAMPNNLAGTPGRLRNWVNDPFVVRDGNRETTAGEILFTYDPTPATYMYNWDNNRAEDAKFAMNLGFVYRHLPTTMDAHVGFQADRSILIFPNSAPARDLWEVHSKMVSKVNSDLGIVGNFYYGNAQANGDSDRTIYRFGGNVKALYKNMIFESHVKINDWGPFDYHRDFNLTFPHQFMLDISTTLGKPDWFILPSTRVGIRGTWRSLTSHSNGECSPRFAPCQAALNEPPRLSPVGFGEGSEWEIRTYIHINIGQ